MPQPKDKRIQQSSDPDQESPKLIVDELLANSSQSLEDQPLSREQYLALVQRVTAEALGILHLEYQTILQREDSDPLMVKNFEITMLVLMQLQMIAATQSQQSHPDLAVPQQGLVDPEGRPLTPPKNRKSPRPKAN